MALCPLQLYLGTFFVPNFRVPHRNVSLSYSGEPEKFQKLLLKTFLASSFIFVGSSFFILSAIFKELLHHLVTGSRSTLKNSIRSRMAFLFFSDLCVQQISCNSSQLIINPAYSMKAQTKTPQLFDPADCCGRFKTGCFVTFVVWATSFNHRSMHLMISLLSSDLFNELKW